MKIISTVNAVLLTATSALFCAQQKQKPNDVVFFYEQVRQIAEEMDDVAEVLRECTTTENNYPQRSVRPIDRDLGKMAPKIMDLFILADYIKAFEADHEDLVLQFKLLKAVDKGDGAAIREVLDTKKVSPTQIIYDAPIFFRLLNSSHGINLLPVFLEAGASIEAPNGVGETLFWNHACSTFIGTFDRFYSFECRQWTQKVTCSAAPIIEKLKGLKKLGANINAQNEEGQTALLYCAVNKRTEIVEALLEMDADIAIKDNKGQSFAEFLLPCDVAKDSKEVMQLKKYCQEVYSKVRAQKHYQESFFTEIASNNK